MAGFRASPKYPGLGPRVDTRPTLYQVWAAGCRWVVCRGLLCRISAVAPGWGDFYLQHLGSRKNKRSVFSGWVPMAERVSPRWPNTLLFDNDRRK